MNKKGKQPKEPINLPLILFSQPENSSPRPSLSFPILELLWILSGIGVVRQLQQATTVLNPPLPLLGTK